MFVDDIRKQEMEITLAEGYSSLELSDAEYEEEWCVSDDKENIIIYKVFKVTAAPINNGLRFIVSPINDGCA